MARNLINKYLWIVDTLHRYHKLSLAQLSDMWVRYEVDDGRPLARRTFMTYRNTIEDMFNISIICDKSTYEYYIEDSSDTGNVHIDWMLDSMSISGTLQNSKAIADRIMLENVPSARHHLPVVIDALKQNLCIKFSYKSYTRAGFASGTVIRPYFVKIFKQLWYVIGYNIKDDKIKTYALDRMKDLTILADKPFTMPRGFSPQEFFKDCFGITTNSNEPKEIKLRVEPVQAKYLRALPLHPSQQEMIQVGGYSVFTYKMRITYDLREQLLSMGSNVEVLAPSELKTQIREELRRALAQYE